jgi:hypothetical protein
MPTEFRLLLGRLVMTGDGVFVDEIWGVDPGQRLLRPHDFWPRLCPKTWEFHAHGTLRQQIIVAGALLLASGIPLVEVKALVGEFAVTVVSGLPSPWGLKSRHVRRWVVNRLEAPDGVVFGID